MAELVVLGVVGGKKLIDNHFDRLPNKAFVKKTYDPRRPLRHLRRRRQPAAAAVAEPHSDSGETDSDSGLHEQQDSHMEGRVETTTTAVLPAPPVSARDAARSREAYVETRRRDVQVSDAPASYRTIEVEPRGRPVVYYMDAGPSRPRRPVIVTRRSSSYHGPRDKYPRYEAVEERQYPKYAAVEERRFMRSSGGAYVAGMLERSRGLDDRQLVARGFDDRQLVVQSSRGIDERQLLARSRREDDRQSQRGSRRGSSPDSDPRALAVHRRRRRDSAPDRSQQQQQQQQKNQSPEDVKLEIDDFFSHTTVGLLGGAVGAAAGAWVTHQAQIATGVDKKGPGAKTAMTLLGAAVGGLTLNAVVDKWEDRKEETEEKEQKWDEKWGHPDDSQDVGKKKGRKDREREN